MWVNNGAPIPVRTGAPDAQNVMSANILQGIASFVIERPAAKFEPRRAGPSEEELLNNYSVISMSRCPDNDERFCTTSYDCSSTRHHSPLCSKAGSDTAL